METKVIEESDLHFDKGKFVETDQFLFAKEANENGSYVVIFKDAAIIVKPNTDEERDALYKKALAESANATRKFKAAILRLKTQGVLKKA